LSYITEGSRIKRKLFELCLSKQADRQKYRKSARNGRNPELRTCRARAPSHTRRLTRPFHGSTGRHDRFQSHTCSWQRQPFSFSSSSLSPSVTLHQSVHGASLCRETRSSRVPCATRPKLRHHPNTHRIAPPRRTLPPL